MPWTGKEFRARHNQGLTAKQADKAAAQANAILRSTGDEGMAIATANKNARRTGGKHKTVRTRTGIGERPA